MKLLLSLLLLAVPVMAAPPKSPAKGTPPATVPAASPSASSSVDTLDAGVKARIEAFLKNVLEKRVQDGFTRLFEGSTVAADQPNRLELLTKNLLLVMDQKCGRMESGSILRVRGVGSTLREVTCIMNCQRLPLRWTIYVYKCEGRWQVIEAGMDADLPGFFEPEKAAAK